MDRVTAARAGRVLVLIRDDIQADVAALDAAEFTGPTFVTAIANLAGQVDALAVILHELVLGL